jgi:hypothetical protein
VANDVAIDYLMERRVFEWLHLLGPGLVWGKQSDDLLQQNLIDLAVFSTVLWRVRAYRCQRVLVCSVRGEATWESSV